MYGVKFPVTNVGLLDFYVDVFSCETVGSVVDSFCGGRTREVTSDSRKVNSLYRGEPFVPNMGKRFRGDSKMNGQLLSLLLLFCKLGRVGRENPIGHLA